MNPVQGEIWWAQGDDKRRPVLVITRNDAIPVLRNLVVAAVTTTIRNVPTELSLGPQHGLPSDCVANFDDLRCLRKGTFLDRVGQIDLPRQTVCLMLSKLADC